MTASAYTLKGGLILDGTGTTAYPGDIVLEGDLITGVGRPASRGSVIDVTGLVVAPGFIDIHSHNDWVLPLPDGPEIVGPNVQQGITTVVTGNCGVSPAPLGSDVRYDAIERMPLVGPISHLMGWQWRTVGEFFEELDSRGLPLNLCMFVGHNTLRATVMGDAQRPATRSEIDQMAALLDAGLREGAIGLSVGLEYFPGRFAGPSEIVALARVAKQYDGVLAAHTRGISALYDQGIEEALAVAEQSACRLQISHVNPMGKANWNALDHLFERVDRARAHGIDVGFDIVTYTTWTVSALELLPHFVQDLGADAVLALAASNDGRSRLRQLIDGSRPAWPPWIGEVVTRNIPLEMGWENLILANPAASAFEDERGETLAQIARRRCREPHDIYFDLVVASAGEARIVNVGYGGDLVDESPLRRLIERPDAIPETDTAPLHGPRLTLPLFFGTMARFLGHFSRDLGLVPIEQAVHRITELPARRVGLEGRGILRAGAHADVAVFDPDTISDQGTYLDPQTAAGIEHVFVNGSPVIREGRYDPAHLPGRILKRGA